MSWNDAQAMLLIGCAWSGYYALHSVLASDRVKGVVEGRWPRFARWYRLAYNAIALALVALPLLLTAEARGELLWSWPGTSRLLADSIAGLAVLGFVASLFSYDLRAFSGLGRTTPGDGASDRGAALRISFFHRFVRHPWYFFGLVILWTREMDVALLSAALITTAYLVIGSRLEENRLIRAHGERYPAYRRAVSGLLPLPWRTLTAEEAAKIESS
jgi:protein-S-isoprenylcysteine O-methyltransferase Ste14